MDTTIVKLEVETSEPTTENTQKFNPAKFETGTDVISPKIKTEQSTNDLIQAEEIENKDFVRKYIGEENVWDNVEEVFSEKNVKSEKNEEYRKINSILTKTEDKLQLANKIKRIENANTEANTTHSSKRKRGRSLHKKTLEIFKCVNCDYTSTRKVRLINHIKCIHLKLKSFKCKWCEHRTTSKDQLTSHIKQIHFQIKKHKCNLCEYRTALNHNLNRHIATVHLKSKNCMARKESDDNQENFQNACDSSEKKNEDKLQSADEINRIGNATTETLNTNIVILKCENCGYTCTRKDHLRTHIECVHLKLKNFKCKWCDHSTSSKQLLTSHIDVVHFQVKKQKCNLCEYSTSLNRNLKRHMATVHRKSKNCKARKKCVDNQDEMQENLQNSETEAARDCPGATSFIKTSDTASNMSVELEDQILPSKNHKCHICEYMSPQKGNLRRHIDGVHLNARNYKCHLCEHSANFKGNLDRHIQNKHGKIQTYERTGTC